MRIVTTPAATAAERHQDRDVWATGSPTISPKERRVIDLTAESLPSSATEDWGKDGVAERGGPALSGRERVGTVCRRRPSTGDVPSRSGCAYRGVVRRPPLRIVRGYRQRRNTLARDGAAGGRRGLARRLFDRGGVPSPSPGPVGGRGIPRGDRSPMDAWEADQPSMGRPPVRLEFSDRRDLRPIGRGDFVSVLKVAGRRAGVTPEIIDAVVAAAERYGARVTRRPYAGSWGQMVRFRLGPRPPD